ncbi:ABC transporter permease [Leucobacter chromiireducens]|uniref:ABC transporter permease n=1 Tax=Leucobacter chromiireducens subsp. solipictus TaxID=398235 RepID=A0ABS1SGR1_9MICO|nr:ABC transporter permease [Leucobacter chromiireducens]MBL3679596.1 ABC transporter permease [Leucobacter chromiireducens subsp. solipictus]
MTDQNFTKRPDANTRAQDTVAVQLLRKHRGDVPTSGWRLLQRRLGPVGVVSLAIIVLVVLMAVLAPVIAPYDPYEGSVTARHEAWSLAHLMGTDQSGRDILSRIMWGARTSLIGPTIVIVITAFLATTLALTAVWFGGKVDAFISRILDILFAFPNMLLAILAVAIFGPSLITASIALAIGFTPYSARVIRSVALRERNLPYVASAQLQGISGFLITVRHILPNVRTQILTGMTINFGYAMIELAALSFLGLGVQPPTPDWGLMVSNGQASLQQGFWEQSIFAGLMIVITVAAFGYVGEQLGGRKAAGRTR